MSSRLKWIILAASLFLVSLTSFLVYGFWRYQKFSQTKANDSTSFAIPVATQSATPAPPDPLAPVNVLLIGYGGANHAGGGLADTIILAHIVPRAKKVHLLSIPRDLWIKLPFSRQADQNSDFYSKINSTFSIGNSTKQYTWRPEDFQGADGGGTLTKNVVAQIIGQPVDYYLAVDFTGFINLIDLLTHKEGLTVDVPYAFTDDLYPLKGEENNLCGFTEEDVATFSASLTSSELEKVFTCRYETISFDAGPQIIASEQLLKFVRSRHSGVGGGDFGRSQRQEAVLTALKDTLLRPSTLPKLPSLIKEALTTIKTDLNLSFVTQALANYGDLSDFEFETDILNNKNYLQDSRSNDRQYILIPKLGQDNYSDIQLFVASMSAQIQP